MPKAVFEQHFEWLFEEEAILLVSTDVGYDQEDEDFYEVEEPENAYRSKIIYCIVSFVAQLFHLA